MDRRERTNDPHLADIAKLTGWQSKMWTAMPGKLYGWNPEKNTVSVRLTILVKQQHADGTTSSMPIPDLLDCPVVFPGGGGFSLTFPLKDNDECLVVFASRCIDAWWQSGADLNEQFEFRMHDLSDGFCIPGVRSVPNVMPAISTQNVQLRSDDGAAFVEIAPNNNIRLKTPTKVTLETPMVECTQALKVNGPITYLSGLTGTGGMVVDGITFGTHVHSGVSTGPSTTGGPL